MKKYFPITCLFCLVSGCGGGSMGGTPKIALSATILAFDNVIVDTTSPAQTVTLSNSGTATLGIVSITASAEFGETNTCGSTLRPGATCVISVTFTPTTTDNLEGTVSISDNATDSPQMISLSGNISFRGRCSVANRPCGTFPCCPGLVCKFRGGSTRAGYSCEPQGSENISGASSYWDLLNANTLE
jgi:hypothetical protein